MRGTDDDVEGKPGVAPRKGGIGPNGGGEVLGSRKLVRMFSANTPNAVKLYK